MSRGKVLAWDQLDEFVRDPVEGSAQANLLFAPPINESRAEVARSAGAAAGLREIGGMFYGAHPDMLAFRASLPKIAGCDVPVLIQGETGTGKEVLARHLHALSARSNKPFVKLNCAAVPSELAESELFGHERGAFTGAHRRKPGIFELAHGGTVMLDEIGDMEFRLQAKLLQVLQDQEFRRVGGIETVRVDVRLISASHHDLRQAGRGNSFRMDLFYRLNGFALTVPPLRERPEDILPLAEFLYRRHGGLGRMPSSSAFEHAMLSHAWPGNIRELETMVRKLIVLQDPGSIARELCPDANIYAAPDFPPANFGAARTQVGPVSVLSNKLVPVDSSAASAVSVLERASQTKEQTEAAAIRSALEATRWNRKQAATLLHLDYKALLYKMKKLGIG